MHIARFLNLQHTGAGIAFHIGAGVEFGPEFFAIARNDAGGKSLEFDPSALAEWVKTIEPVKGERLGCPARDARVVEGDKQVSVVSAIYRYTEQQADHYLKPHLEQYTKEVLGSAKGLKP